MKQDLIWFKSYQISSDIADTFLDILLSIFVFIDDELWVVEREFCHHLSEIRFGIVHH